ncbi:MAG: ABC transporter permease [Candidatus Odinarchaeota archaeon]|nr:ABC transporter permease [Candidatus Odinarchaeota archaeon]
MGKVWNVFAKRLDKVGYGIIDLIVITMNAIRPGWAIRNKARIDEWKLMVYAFNRSILGVIGVILLICYLILGIYGPIIAPYKYNEYPVTKLPETYLVEPGKYGYLLGSDVFGRDLLSLLLYGARFSLALTVLTVIISAPLGTLLGLISGYFGGKIDELIQRLTDIMYAFPSLVLCLALAAVLPDRLREIISQNEWMKDFLLWAFAGDPKDIATLAPFLSIIIAIAIVGWPGYTRLIRGMVLSIKENVYVEAARALGLSDFQIIRKHVLPNVLSILIVIITFDLSGIVILGAALSFLGLGAQDPFTDWGKLVFTGSRYFPDKWWLIIFPGATLFLVGLGWMFFGDTLRDVFDPTTRRRLEYGVMEPIYAGDIINLIGGILLMVSIIYGAFEAWDVMVSLYFVAAVVASYIIYKAVWALFGSEKPKPPIFSLAGLAPTVYVLINMQLLSSMLLLVSLLLMFIAPYFMHIRIEKRGQ